MMLGITQHWGDFMRNKAEKRHNDWKKAIRKRRIDRERTGENLTHKDWYDNLHQYSKNKIHCSCGMCSRYRKTNNRGRKRKIHGNYAPSKNWSESDRRKLDEMEDQLLDNE